MNSGYFLAGLLFWGSGIYGVRTAYKSKTMSAPLTQYSRRERIITMVLIAVLILCCILPMGLAPYWNGERHGESRNQYETMAESILDGRITLEYGDMDPRLLEMENPYDYEKRKELGVSYHWDHVLYNGQYYMYFGIVPVFLLFLPYRIITGTSLTTYHASQVFTAFFIVGVFLLFFLWAKKWFPKISIGLYLILSTAFSVMSVWYISYAPALYCTAICSGLCMEIWSIFFFSKAVWDSETERQSVLYGVLGSLFGALAFGCRPTVALANLLAVPMFLHFLKGKKFNAKLIRQIAAVMAPYVIVGALLMYYNYIRFDNPFEFGQTYQLTNADQSNYGNIISRVTFFQLVNGLLKNFIAYRDLSEDFPYVYFNSVLMNFPICIAAYICFFHRNVRQALKEHQIRIFSAVLFGLPFLITIVEVAMSPRLLERYRSDIYWLIGMLGFLAFGFFYQSMIAAEEEKYVSRRKGKALNSLPEEADSVVALRRKYNLVFAIFAYITLLMCIMLWMIPYDGSFTKAFPEYLEIFHGIFTLGLLP